jgi:hypothetical protein
MKVEIKLYTDELKNSYNNFLNISKNSMFYHSLSYRKFLKETFSNCEDYYFCAFIENEIHAVLPIFVQPGKFGNVLNSLPFFGSNGGIIYRGEKLNEVCKINLLKSLEQLCKMKKAFSCTIIDNPFEKDQSIYKLFNANLYEKRTGQITKLPVCENEVDCKEKLLKLFHSKTKAMIRKGLNSNFKIVVDNSLESFDSLFKIHRSNMLRIGGKHKKKIIFDTIFRVFKPNEEYRIYNAKYNDETISSLLVFYHKDMVEYFCPATELKFKDKQPLSVLIFMAMKDSILDKKSLFWNWGGTWLTQVGVYRFKSKWGTIDYNYNYHIKTFFDFKKNEYSANDLTQNYENFYTLPYSLCKS